MFQFDDIPEAVFSAPTTPMTSYYTPLIGVEQRCNDCDVMWRGNDPCWFCGQYTPSQRAAHERQGTAPKIV